MMRRVLPILLPLIAAVPVAAHHSPYASEGSREIKALSPEEVEGLLAGRGMGLARAAELNHHPGPMHVLELRDRLNLTPEQEAAVRDSQARMLAEARGLGAALVERERELDRAFAEARITPEALDRLTAEIGTLQGRLRRAHLAAHLEMRALLTPAQVAAYDEARDYTAAGAAPPPTHGPHRHMR